MKTILWLIVALVLACAWCVGLRPTSLGGGTTYVMIRGTSMLPTYESGDLVITRRADSYGPGDVVAYRVPEGDVGEGIVVIHRITGGSADEGFVLQGDNNSHSDPWFPKPTDVVGKAWVRTPNIGLVLGFLRDPLPLAALAASIAVVFVLFPAEKEKRRSSSDVPVAQLDVEAELARDDDALDLARPFADL